MSGNAFNSFGTLLDDRNQYLLNDTLIRNSEYNDKAININSGL